MGPLAGLAILLFFTSAQAVSVGLSPTQVLAVTNVTSSGLALGDTNAGGAFCASNEDWTGGSSLNMRFFYNCFKANHMFWTRSVHNRGDTEFEFLNMTNPPVYDNPLVRTPLRYTYRESHFYASSSLPDFPC